MARKSLKATAQTAEQGMNTILSTEPLKTIDEAAEYVGVAGIRLLELFSELLDLPEAMGWETVPTEHDHLLNEFKAQVDGTQALAEATPELTLQQETPQQLDTPAMEEEPEPATKKGKAKSSALTRYKPSTRITERKPH